MMHRPQVAIVTGAAQGIGAATVCRLLTDGRHCVAVDIDASALHDRWDGTKAVTTVHGDVASTDTAEESVLAAGRAGGLDVLVNNAGLAIDRAFVSQTEQQWRTVWQAAVEGTRVMSGAVVEAMQEAARQELAAGGVPTPRRVINTVPATTTTATAGGSAAAAAGGAVAALTRTLARELGPYGIRVNAVMVGYINTRMTHSLEGQEAKSQRQGIPEPVRQMAAATTALGRFGSPEEVAAVHAFLASAGADYITGVVLPVTGGLLGT